MVQMQFPPPFSSCVISGEFLPSLSLSDIIFKREEDNILLTLSFCGSNRTT